MIKKLILFAVLIVSFCLSGKGFTQNLEDKLILTDWQGKSIAYGRVIKEPKTVLFLWTKTCPYCLEYLAKMSQDCGIDYGAKIYYINIGDKISDVQRIVARLDLNNCVRENILFDPDGVLAREFFVIGVPTVIFLKDGEPIRTDYRISKSVIEKVYKNAE